MRGLIAALSLMSAVARADDTMGTANPILVEQVAPDGHWAFVCQAREDSDHDGKIEVSVGLHGEPAGDVLVPYFIEGKGAGERYDQLLSSDRAGRWVALRKALKIVLVDTVRHTKVELGTLPAEVDLATQQVSIDPLGQKIVYPRDSHTIVRELATGKERSFALASSLAWSAKLSPGGTWLLSRVVRVDSDHDGKMRLPAQKTTQPPSVCRGPATVYGHYGLRGDATVGVVVDTRTGTSRDLDDVVYADEDALVRRVNEAVVVERAGKTTQLVPASCNGMLRWLDLARDTAIAECRAQSKGDSGPASLRIYRRGEPVSGTLVGWAMGRDALPSEQKRLYVANASDGSQVFDGATDRVFARAEQALAAADASVLLLRRADGGLRVLRTDATNESIELGVHITLKNAYEPPHVYTSKALVAVDGYLVDLAKAKVVGAYDGDAIAVGADARVLTKHGTFGPLVWRAPVGP